MMAALLFAINIPLSKLLLNKIELTMMASYLYLGAGFGVGLLLLISRKKQRSEDVEKYTKKIKDKYPDLKVIRGNEIYLCRNGLTSENFEKGKDKYYHYILLAKDAIGHQQIREISTRAWRRSYMARGMRRVPTYYQDLIDIIKNIWYNINIS